MTRLWDKGAPLDARVLAYTAGDDYLLDERLVHYDVQASLAHAHMLHDQQLLSAQDLAAIRTGLNELAQSHARGEWHIELADEDGQTALETRLTQKIGVAGARIHLGRSRNDQVLTALRLYLLDTTRELATAARQVANALDDLAAREAGTVLPGYTHMQQAMPSSVPLWAGGFATEIRDDADGLEGVLLRLDRNPLGSAAGYGAPGLPLDRDATTPGVGFQLDADSGDGGAAVARQGRSTSALRDNPADAGPGTLRRRRAAVLHPGVRLHWPGGCVHHRVVHHAAEAQPRCLRAAARPHCHRTCRAG